MTLQPTSLPSAGRPCHPRDTLWAGVQPDVQMPDVEQQAQPVVPDAFLDLPQLLDLHGDEPRLDADLNAAGAERSQCKLQCLRCRIKSEDLPPCDSMK